MNSFSFTNYSGGEIAFEAPFRSAPANITEDQHNAILNARVVIIRSPNATPETTLFYTRNVFGEMSGGTSIINFYCLAEVWNTVLLFYKLTYTIETRKFTLAACRITSATAPTTLEADESTQSEL